MLRRFADAIEKEATRIEGDGRAEFLPDMTEEEYQVYRHEVEHGWKPFMDRVLGRKPSDV